MKYARHELEKYLDWTKQLYTETGGLTKELQREVVIKNLPPTFQEVGYFDRLARDYIKRQEWNTDDIDFPCVHISKETGIPEYWAESELNHQLRNILGNLSRSGRCDSIKVKHRRYYKKR